MQIFKDMVFEDPIEIIEAFDNEGFKSAFSRMEFLRKRADINLLGYIRYEAKEIFLGNKIKSEFPLLYFEVYQKAKCKRQNSKSNLISQPINLSTNQLIDYKVYKNNINRIKEEIACGNTYQVNYTYDWKIETPMQGFDLYNTILPNQITPYNAYIKNKYEEILCFSPELFFEIEGSKIKTKPMKGTVKRGEDEKEDLENIEFLKNDEKNRAENVMIVDLLRNDLGKIAKTGSVKVDKLFEVETHKTVHQMTSEISAELEDNTTLYEIFEAIFPCGSITGAPKINTMKIIDEIEQGKRDVYCGAIGLISKEKTVFSVPIRTLQKKNTQDFFTCRVGGAIVWDSTPEEEWEETLTKIKFLELPHREEGVNISDFCRLSTRHCEEGQSPDAAIQKNEFGLLHCVRNDGFSFQLVETILIKNGEAQFLDVHLNRMKSSALEFGFVFDEKSAKSKVQNVFDSAVGQDCYPAVILRLLLDKKGDLQTQILPLDEIKTNKIAVSKSPVNSKEKFLYYKTTCRPWYEDSMKKIKAGKIFDEIFFNEKGELTEGARSNVVLQIDGEPFTPPVECGLLNGIMRQELLNQNKVKEKVLYLDDLKKAEKIFCINSVRGIVEVEL